jgi:hypothetical protein
MTDQREKPFQEGLRHLRRFVQREGHARPPSKHVEDGYALGSWVWLRRTWRRQGRLPASHQRALERLPGWSWDPMEDKFRARLHELADYAKAHGHCHLPRGHRLAAWSVALRRKVARRTLSDGRLRLVLAIRGWAAPPPGRVLLAAGECARRVERVKAYLRQSGRQRLPSHYADADGLALDDWIRHMRGRYCAGVLPRSIAALLETIPDWPWLPRREKPWELGYELLRRHATRTGTVQVPRDHKPVRGVNLNNWIRAQRSRYQAGTMPPDHVRLLEALPGWRWHPTRSRWQAGIAALRSYLAREGHLRVPTRHKEGAFTLGTWVQTVRTAYRRDRLHGDKVQELERIPGWIWQVRRPYR